MQPAADSEPPARVTASRDEAGTLILDVVGDLDLATAPILDELLHQHRPLTGRVVIDLTALTFIDSSGLRGLVRAQHTTVEDTGSRPRLRGCSATAIRLFELSGLADSFHIER